MLTRRTLLWADLLLFVAVVTWLVVRIRNRRNRRVFGPCSLDQTPQRFIFFAPDYDFKLPIFMKTLTGEVFGTQQQEVRLGNVSWTMMDAVSPSRDPFFLEKFRNVFLLEGPIKLVFVIPSDAGRISGYYIEEVLNKVLALVRKATHPDEVKFGIIVNYIEYRKEAFAAKDLEPQQLLNFFKNHTQVTTVPVSIFPVFKEDANLNDTSALNTDAALRLRSFVDSIPLMCLNRNEIDRYEIDR